MKVVCLAIALCCLCFFGYSNYSSIEEPTVHKYEKHEMNVDEFFISGVKSPVWFSKTKNNTCCLFIKFANEGYRNYKFSQPAALIILSKLMLKGAGKYDAASLMEELSLNNITLTITPGADSINVMCYSTANNFQKMIDILGVVLRDAHLSLDQFDIVKNEVTQNIAQQKCMPDSIALEKLVQLELPEDHPYNINCDDLLNSCDKCTLDDVVNAYNNSFSNSDAVITIAGNLKREDVILELEKLAVCLQNKKNSFVDGKQSCSFLKTNCINCHKTIDPQVVVRFSHPGVFSESKDFFAFEIGVGILGKRGFGSRLFNEIREKLGLSYGISCEIEETDLIVAVRGKASTRPENVDNLIEAIKDQFMKISDVTQSELDDYKVSLYASDVLMSAKDVVSFLRRCRRRNIEHTSVNEYMQNYYSVTLEQLQDVMRKYIKKEHILFSVVGNVGGKE